MLEGQKVIFGGIVRGSLNEVIVEIIHNKKSETLIDVVRRRILPGTIINNDCWSTYPRIFIELGDHNLPSKQ